MISRYLHVVFIVLFVVVSANAQESSNSSMITASPTISANHSSAIPTTPISSQVVINTLLVSSTTSANTSSTSPTPASTSHVTPVSSPTPAPTKAPTKTPKPHGTPTKGRSFDAASFFGGIILGIILAIACVLGYMWWQNKRKSYHSL